MPEDLDLRRPGIKALVDVEALLRDADGVDASGRAAVLGVRVAAVLVAVRPAERRARRVVASERARRAIAVELLVADRVRLRELLLGQVVAVVARLLRAGGEPPADEVEVRRREAVPEAAGGLLAGVFGLDDRHPPAELLHRLGGGRRVAVQHRAHVFGLGDGGRIGDRAAAHEAPAVRVEFALEVGHLLHVRGADPVVAGLPEEDRRRVAEVDDRVAHRLDALLPGAALRLVLLVARRTDVDDALRVAGADERRLRRDVHPADEVRLGLAHERHVVFVEPVRRDADRRPARGRALRVAGEPRRHAVDRQAPLAVVGDRAEAGADNDLVEDRLAVDELHLHVVEVRRVRRPEFQAVDASRDRRLVARLPERLAVDLGP